MIKNTSSKILSLIFGGSGLEYGLKEFDKIKPAEVLDIFEKEKGKFYIKCLKRDKDILLYNKEKNLSKPEEVVRQLWLYKLTKLYNYPLNRIEVEKSVNFGREVHKKSADIVVYTKDNRETPHIIIEVKNPSEEKGLDQLRSYISAEWAPIGVLSNGIQKVVLYRPYPQDFQTLRDLPRADQTPEDVLEEKLTLENLEVHFDLVKILQILEELVLAGSGRDSFTEIFKLIYAKLFDEKEAKTRKDYEVHFRASKDPKITYNNINKLFKGAVEEWPDIFSLHDKIELEPAHLSVCVGEFEKIKLLDSDLETIDAAFEYLLTDVAKGKKGQYFTPRHVIDMAVKMLSPKENEYIIDPACGSGGFLIHAMRYVGKKYLKGRGTEAVTNYAKKYLFGIDFDDKAVKIARAMMLIAGDGKSHILNLNSLNTREWKGDDSAKLHARAEMQKRLYEFGDYEKDSENKDDFKYFDFDILLSNPPFAGDVRQIKDYELAKKESGKYRDKMERHILFIERALQFIKPGGRIAIVLPQGVLNNTNMQYVREFLLNKTRLLAVVGLHINTFKPHTGTKTSVLFLQKWEKGEKPPKDYPIFMAVSKKAGKDNSGKYVYRKNPDGSIAHDSKSKKILEHDLDQIANEFIDFAKKEGVGFGSKK